MLWLGTVLSVIIFLLILGIIIGWNIAKPSAKRTILLSRSLKSECGSKTSVSKQESIVSPVYVWMTMPRDTASIKGRFTLTRNSQRAFSFDREGKLVCKTLSKPTQHSKKSGSRSGSMFSLARNSLEPGATLNRWIMSGNRRRWSVGTHSTLSGRDSISTISEYDTPVHEPRRRSSTHSEQ